MTLTKKCKEDFEKWYKNPERGHIGGLRKKPIWFYTLPQSMQYGVYVDFFDSVDMRVEIQVIVSPTMSGGSFKEFRACILFEGRFVNTLCGFVDRNQSQRKAIEKANELYNEKYQI